MVADTASDEVLQAPEVQEKAYVHPGHPSPGGLEGGCTTRRGAESKGLGGAVRVCASEGQGGSGGQGQGLDGQVGLERPSGGGDSVFGNAVEWTRVWPGGAV